MHTCNDECELQALQILYEYGLQWIVRFCECQICQLKKNMKVYEKYLRLLGALVDIFFNNLDIQFFTEFS